MNQGEVVLVTLADGKRRPAVVVSSNWFNNRGELVVAAATSQPSASGDRDEIALSASDLGLPSPAVVLAGKLITIQESQVAKTLAKLPDKSLHAVLERLSEVLGLL